MLLRSMKWVGWFLLALTLVTCVFFALLDWNWLRGPITRMTLEKTGRELAINGDLKVTLGWPLARAHVANVTFANPPWAKEKQMVTVAELEFTIDLPQLLLKKIVLREVRLSHPVVFLERNADGRKNWLLDQQQQDKDARIPIGRLTVDQGRISYDDPEQKTSIQAAVSTPDKEERAGAGIAFTAAGQYKGFPLKGHGTGGLVLALDDDSTPYPLTIDAAIGDSAVQAEGSITNLMKFSAVDMRIALRGESLAELFPLLGIALPETRAYNTTGHLLHSSEMWRYEKFSGQIGKSDIAGSLVVDTQGVRSFLHGDLVFKLLDFADLGPLIGAQPKQGTGKKQEKASSPAASARTLATTTGTRVLPDLPFHTERWGSVDADVKLDAKTIHRAEALPIDNLVTRLQMRDSVVTLDPLDFGVAGGHLAGTISLDGRQDPIRARAKGQARKMLISKLFPTLDVNKTSTGQVNGEFDLTGTGNSVAGMFATSAGKVALIVNGGEISELMMETIGLHLWEMLQLTIAGDKGVKIRCGVADFSVKAGVMQTNALVIDTDVANIGATGSIDLGQETLDLTVTSAPKKGSPVALRGPIYIRGSFANPGAQLDAGKVAARSLGAIALGIVNPLLALFALVETGPGLDSDCGRLIREAKEPAQKAPGEKAPSAAPAAQ